MSAALEEGTGARAANSVAGAALQTGPRRHGRGGGGGEGSVATPWTTLHLAFRDGGVAVVVGGRKIGIADSERLPLRGLFLDGEGVALTLQASVTARCRGGLRHCRDSRCRANACAVAVPERQR